MWCQGAHVRVRGQLAMVNSLLLPCQVWGWNLSCPVLGNKFSSSENSHQTNIHDCQAIITLHPNKANFLCHFLPAQFIYKIIFMHILFKNYSFLDLTLLNFMTIISIIISFHTFSILDSFIHSCEKKFPTNRKKRKRKMRICLKKNRRNLLNNCSIFL